MKNLKIGIVGVGNIGSAHLSSIYRNEIEGMTVNAVCDIEESRLKVVYDSYPNLETYKNYEEMLAKAKIDAVLIATPHPYHSDMAIKALKTNKHILVEKPVDITVSKAKALNEYAQKSGKIFGIMFNQRTNGLFIKAKVLVQSGELGNLKRSVWNITNWYRTERYYKSSSWRATWSGEGGGVLLNQAPHNLDIWTWICGVPSTVTAFCNTKHHNIEVEDEATLYTEYKDGSTGVFITSTGDYPGTNRFEICGTKGKVVIENGVLKHWKLKTDERKVCKSSTQSSPCIEYDYFEYKAESETGHKGILQNFANAVLKGESLIAPGIDGINELTISNAAYLSEWYGNKKIPIPFSEEDFDCLLNQKTSSPHNSHTAGTEVPKDYNPRWQIKW